MTCVRGARPGRGAAARRLPAHAGRHGDALHHPRAQAERACSAGWWRVTSRCTAGWTRISLTGGVLAEAERRAAVLWGADVARFSVAGSTHGNQALALAVGRPGDRVVVPRTLHRSLLLGLVLAGLAPRLAAHPRRPRLGPAARLPRGRRRGVPPDAGRRRGLRRRPHVRRDRRRAGRGRRPRARGRPAAAGRRGVGRALRLPPGAARPRAAGRGRRAGHQRAQDAARLLPGGAGPGPDRTDRPRPAAERLRRHPHHEPGRCPAREHRRRPRAPAARRGGLARPARTARRRGPRAARRGRGADGARGGRGHPARRRAGRAPARTGSSSAASCARRASRWSSPTGTG